MRRGSKIPWGVRESGSKKLARRRDPQKKNPKHDLKENKREGAVKGVFGKSRWGWGSTHAPDVDAGQNSHQQPTRRKINAKTILREERRKTKR